MEKLLADNYSRIIENIHNAKIKSGRFDTDVVRVMAVTKGMEVNKINAALKSVPIDLIGENRVQEFLLKKPDYSKCEIHFIGGLQTNKVRQIIREVSMIQTVDSLKLAHEIDRQAKLNGITIDVLIQVNIGKEDTKNGIFPEKLNELVREVDALTGVKLRGLMAIPPIEDSVKHFEKMQKLYEDLKSPGWNTLSMGMSGDYAEAVEFGATIVRLGNALFGQRSG